MVPAPWAQGQGGEACGLSGFVVLVLDSNRARPRYLLGVSCWFQPACWVGMILAKAPVGGLGPALELACLELIWSHWIRAPVGHGDRVRSRCLAVGLNVVQRELT